MHVCIKCMVMTFTFHMICTIILLCLLCIYYSCTSNHKRNLGTVTLYYADAMKVDYLRSLVNWECRTDGHYKLVLGKECTQPFQEVISYVMRREEYELPGDYKLLFETLCPADYMGEVDFQKLVAN